MGMADRRSVPEVRRSGHYCWRWSRLPCFVLSIVLVLATLSCSNPAEVCTAELRVRVTPASLDLSVGESTCVTVALSTCGGSKKLSDTFSWSAQDTTIVRVDTATSRITGRLPGSTFVTGAGKVYGQVAYVPVTVIP